MTPKVAQQVEALRDMTVAELREHYAEAFGESTRSSHKDFLRKRITWRLQANEEGGLSERAPHPRRKAGQGLRPSPDRPEAHGDPSVPPVR